jgi:hypothetical protein
MGQWRAEVALQPLAMCGSAACEVLRLIAELYGDLKPACNLVREYHLQRVPKLASH